MLRTGKDIWEDTLLWYSQYPSEGIRRLLSRCRPNELEEIENLVIYSPVIAGIKYDESCEHIKKQGLLRAITMHWLKERGL